MKKLLISLLLICALVGCSRSKPQEQVFEENTQEQTFNSAYSLISKQGVLHEEGFLFFDESLTNGFAINAGESVNLIGEGEGFYLAVYGDKKGYIKKSSVLISEGTDENNDEAVKIIKEQNQKSSFVYYETITEITTQATTTAAPPKDLYTKGNASENNTSGVISFINSKRSEKGLSALTKDGALQEKAEYYADIFASKKQLYSIDGCSVQAVGKVSTINDLTNSRFDKACNENGFYNSDISKIGVAVSKTNNGYYYVVLAK